MLPIMEWKRVNEGENEEEENKDPNGLVTFGKGQNKKLKKIDLEINPANVDPVIIKRNLRAMKVHMHQQMTDFTQFSQDMNAEH